MATIDQIQIPSGTYDIMVKSFYGTCSTAAATAAKVVTLSNDVGWNLVPGVIIGVKFSNNNAASSVKLNVNGSGAKSIYFGNYVYTGTAVQITGWKDYIIYYMYDGTNWMFLNNSYNFADTNNYVGQTVTTTSANYEVLFSATADNTTRTEGARKNSNLLFNPSTGNLQATQLNGVTIGSSPKFTDTTYSSQAAASGGTAVSLVTTGEKYTWNNKSNLAIGTTATTAAAGNHTHATSIAASSGTNQLTLAASTKYALTAGGTSYIFTTPPNTTYESKAAASGGTEVSLVTTGEKYTWNNKSNLTIGTTSTTAAAGNHTHKYAGSATAGGPATTLAGTYSGSGGQLAPNTVSGGNVKAVMMNNPKGITGFNTYCDCLLMDTYTGSDVPIVTGIGLSKKGTSSAADTIPRAYIFNGIKGNTTTWANMAEVVTTKNIKTATVGSASAGTAIAADDITAWSAGTAPSLTVTSVARDDITAWSAGTLPTLGTAIPADDITAWSAGSLPSLTYNSTNHSLTFSQGSLPSLSYTAKSIPNVTGVGTLPSLSYTARSVGSASNWSAGTVPSLSYTARSIPNISVTSTTVATGGIN